MFILPQIEQVLEAPLRIDLDVLQVEAVELHLLLEAPVEVLDDLLADVASSLVRARKPILRSALMRRSVSRRITPSRNSGMPSRIGGDSSATAPKSSSTSVAVRADQHVPGVRIGVVDAVDEDHLAVDADDAAARAPCWSIPSASSAGDVADLHAFDEGRREHAAACDSSRMRQREDDARRRFAKFFGDALDVVGLAHEVELLRRSAP